MSRHKFNISDAEAEKWLKKKDLCYNGSIMG